MRDVPRFVPLCLYWPLQIQHNLEPLFSAQQPSSPSFPVVSFWNFDLNRQDVPSQSADLHEGPARDSSVAVWFLRRLFRPCIVWDVA